MSRPYLGEIKMFAGNFAPQDWAMCDGHLLPTSEHAELFALIGTTYGGDGENTFALPDLRGRIPIHNGNGIRTGEVGGSETVILNLQELPAHTHPAKCHSASSDSTSPQDSVWAVSTLKQYAGSANNTLNPAAVSPIGGNQPHTNMMPFLSVNFIIALKGISPR